MKMWAKINLHPTVVYQVLPHSFYWFSKPLPQSIGSSIVKLQGSVANAIICFLLWQVSCCFSIMLHSTMCEAHNYLPEIRNQKITDWLSNQDRNSPNSKLYSIELLLICLSSCLLIFLSMYDILCVRVYVSACMMCECRCAWIDVCRGQKAALEINPCRLPWLLRLDLHKKHSYPLSPSWWPSVCSFIVANSSEEMHSLVRNLF